VLDKILEINCGLSDQKLQPDAGDRVLGLIVMKM
jgi:hypothetical protein